MRLALLAAFLALCVARSGPRYTAGDISGEKLALRREKDRAGEGVLALTISGHHSAAFRTTGESGFAQDVFKIVSHNGTVLVLNAPIISVHETADVDDPKKATTIIILGSEDQQTNAMVAPPARVYVRYGSAELETVALANAQCVLGKPGSSQDSSIWSHCGERHSGHSLW
jgi:hypothetical protein